ncbi:MAG TPA: hypothetical protein VJ755_02850 [Gemmatimonadales bacterium]|nr:hypothetical protein [Gemmatimonadales bacterium]
MLFAPCDDTLGQGGSDARQSCDFAHVCPVEIDSLPRQKWTCELRGATRGCLQSARRRDGSRLQLYVTWR